MTATVKFGTAEATGVTVRNDTTIECTTPPGAGTADVSVTTDGGTAAKTGGFTYQPPPPPEPTVTAVAPATGPAAGGTATTITGTGFKEGK